MREITKSEIKMGIKWFLFGLAFGFFILIMSLYPDLIVLPELSSEFDDDLWWIWYMLLLTMG